MDPHAPVVERVRATFTPEELVELTYAAGTFAGYSKLIVILGGEWGDEIPVIEIPTPGG